MRERYFAVALSLLLLAVPLAAQDAVRKPDAEQLLESARQTYGPRTAAPRCDPDSQDEDVIVVCAELEEQEQFRVRTDEDAENDYARETMDKGAVPRAPNVAGPGIFQGPATFRLAPPIPVLIIDLAEIPVAPAGSDADLIGNGEKAP